MRVENKMDLNEYHAHSSLGSTTLKRYLAGDFSHEALLEGHPEAILDMPAEQSTGKTRGQQWHDLLYYGPEEFMNRIVCLPEKFQRSDGSTSTSKAAKEWMAENAQEVKTLVSVADSVTLCQMFEQLQANSAAWELYQNKEHQEVSLFWEWHGVEVKCRPDMITNLGILVDWKTTRDAQPSRTFGRTCMTFGYGLAAALYQEGCRLSGLCNSPMTFVVSSTVHPFECHVCVLPEQYLVYCRQQLTALLSDIARRRKEQDWSPNGYGQIHTADVWWPGKNGNLEIVR